MKNKINGVSAFATTKQAFRAAAMACVFAGAALVSNAALAADISKKTSVIELTDGSGGFFSVFGKNNASGTFTDNYTFSIDALSSFSGITTSISTKPSIDLLELTGFKLTDSFGNVFNGTRVQSGQIDEWNLLLDKLAVGVYTLSVSGTVLTNAAASYSGTINLSAVPEPETYAMLLAGLGLVGFVARRRKLAVKAA
ncbi:FxDxF family PEP-CTERM protein [Janthinobacterium sp. Mn2066]|uniref:FxDxF family PEP-CTERM protein n=1 Tax=Janthinobacterium sp. Mn2066 TaxID=3395264 RepID=UPI003BE3564E